MAKTPNLKGKDSQREKEIFLISVALSIPTFTMSCFKLPTSFCEEIKSIIARFWWAQRGDERSIHWLNWKKTCEPKGRGGLDFKNLKSFNLTLFAKQGWRLIQNEDSLLHRVFKARYFFHTKYFEAKLGPTPFYTWREIWEAKKVVLQGRKWRIGDGVKAKIFLDA